MKPCTVCSHPAVGTINALLADRSARSVAAEFQISYDALTRHARNRHATRPRRRDVPAGGTFADPLDELTAVLRERALAGSDPAAREYRLALAAQAAARHATAPVASLETTDEWQRLRARILAALEPFPEARQAVADGLGEVGA